MKIGNRNFKPGLIPTIATLLILPVLLRLGFWQLERAEEKRHLIELFQQQNQQGPLLIKDFVAADEKLNYRSAKVEGSYQVTKQIFVDNTIHNGQVGVYAITPFRLKDSPYSILVNRGWVAMMQDRAELPKLETPDNINVLSGKIKAVEKKPFMLGTQFQSNAGWPALVQWVNIEDIEKKSGLKLLPYILLLDKNEATGFVREWKPVVMLPEKSTSYAVQWFALATALVIIYVVVNMKKIKSESEDAE